MQRLTVTKKTEKRPVIIRGRDVERDCRSIVNQLVTSMPKDVLLRTSFPERGKLILIPVQITEEVKVKSKSSFTRKVRFTDAKAEYEPGSDCSSGDETMSGESDIFRPVQDDLSGERLMRPPRDRILCGESRNITDRVERDGVESLDSSDDSRPSLGATLDEIYQRLIDCDFTREDPGLAMFVVALLKALGREGRGNRPTEVVLMLAFGESGTAKRGRNRLMRWRRGEMSGHDLAREP